MSTYENIIQEGGRRSIGKRLIKQRAKNKRVNLKSGVTLKKSCTNGDRGRKQAMMDGNGVGLFCLIEGPRRGAEREEVWRQPALFGGASGSWEGALVEVFDQSKLGS